MFKVLLQYFHRIRTRLPSLLCSATPQTHPLLLSTPLVIPVPIPVSVTPSESLSFVKSIPACYHHRLETRDPVLCSASRHRSRTSCVAMYCTTVFSSLDINVSIVSISDTCRATYRGGYSQITSVCLHGCIPDRLLATL